jgi:hypothetical protein
MASTYPATIPANVKSCFIMPFINPAIVVRQIIVTIMISSILIDYLSCLSVFSPKGVVPVAQ